MNKHNIDPVYVEPDIICLSRFLLHNLEKQNTTRTLFAIVSATNGYIIVPPSATQKQSILRTFLVGSAQDKLNLLASQIAVSSALLSADEKIDLLNVFDSSASIEADRLREAVGIKTEIINLTKDGQLKTQDSELLTDSVGLAIAAGAALAFDDKQRVDFRADFNPYQGKQMKLEKNLRIISICAVICMVALGIFSQTVLSKVNNPREARRESFNADYMLVMPASKEVPRSLIVASKELENERRHLQNITRGYSSGGQQTVTDKLALVLKAFNASAEAAKLDIQTIDITPSSIRITGSTTNEAGIKRLRDAIAQNNLKIDNDTTTPKADRFNFVLNLSVNTVPKGVK